MEVYLGDVTHIPRGYSHDISSCHKYQPRIMSRVGRKLDHLKRESKGATNEAPTCAVPMHAPQTGAPWQGVGEVSSACEVGC